MAKKSNKKRGRRLLFALVVLLVLTATAGQVDLTKVDLTDLSSVVEAFTADSSDPLTNYQELSLLPPYTDEAVVTLNHDQPYFTKEELSLDSGSWQNFSNLDPLNRVGPANAMLQKKMMPHKERSDISQVYPSGWKQKRIEGGEWLYNRSHLIAYQFTGENDNWKNLFTATQQMNQDVMRQYEEKVAAYLKKTDHHVRYRVTPYFKENERVARGVEIEAQSIEDQQICFNVFLYNVQKGYQINYSNGTSKKNP